MMTNKNIKITENSVILTSNGLPYKGIAPHQISLTGGEIPVEFRVNTEKI